MIWALIVNYLLYDNSANSWWEGLYYDSIQPLDYEKTFFIIFESVITIKNLFVLLS